MNLSTESMLLFADDAASAARMQAIDHLHGATAIYTAEGVVDELLERLDWPRGFAKLVDPSCGDGIFLGRSLVKALATGSYSDEALLKIIEGWEIHPHACEQARARVEAILVAHGRCAATAASMAQAMVHNRDFLTEGPTEPTWHAIAGNPPYLRWLNVPQLLREDYAAHVPSYAAGDMLHSFLDRCARTLHPGGEIAFVTSDRWLFNMGAANLRETLGQRLSIRHLERLDAKTAFYRPKQRRAGTPPRIHPVSVVLGQSGGQPLSRAAIYPGVDSQRYAGMPTLSDIAEVRIAPWLGSFGVFVVTAEQAREAGLPDEVLVPAVDTDDIAGMTLGQPTRFAILTRPDERPCDAVMEHLARTVGKMAPRGRQGKAWMPPESFHRLDLTRESLLVPRIANSPKAIRVPAGVLPINHNLSIVTSSPERLVQVEAALASDLAAQWVREHAAPLENGYFSLTTTLLRKLPIAIDGE